MPYFTLNVPFDSHLRPIRVSPNKMLLRIKITSFKTLLFQVHLQIYCTLRPFVVHRQLKSNLFQVFKMYVVLVVSNSKNNLRYVY